MELTIPTFTTVPKLEIPTIKYDPELMAMASKLSNVPSAQTIQNQAAIQSPGDAGFFNDLWSTAKDVLMTLPIAFTVGGYTIGRPTPPPVIPPVPTPKPFIETYMPYILVGGAGVILLIALRER